MVKANDRLDSDGERIAPVIASADRTYPRCRFRAPGTQTRHLARISTVDFRKLRALNSLRRVSTSAKAQFPSGAVGVRTYIAEHKENSTGETNE